MDIQIATLCDFAADYNDRMVISGTFDALFAKSLPVVRPSCILAMRILLLPEDSGEHTISINVIDEDGTSVDPKNMPKKAPMGVKVPDEVAFLTRPLFVNLQGLSFPKEGVYSVDVTIDDELVVRLPLRVMLVKPQQMPGQQPPA